VFYLVMTDKDLEQRMRADWGALVPVVTGPGHHSGGGGGTAEDPELELRWLFPSAISFFSFFIVTHFFNKRTHLVTSGRRPTSPRFLPGRFIPNTEYAREYGD
jgi:hypothetical protein